MHEANHQGDGLKMSHGSKRGRQNKWAWMVLACMAAVLLTAGTGCESGPFAKKDPALPEDDDFEAPALPEEGLAVSPNPRFPDIPLPISAEEDPERTYVYESPKLQIGRMVYTTKADVNELANFYIRECPAAGWELKERQQADGFQMLFTRPGKRLEVHIKNRGFAKGRVLTLNLVPEDAALTGK